MTKSSLAAEALGLLVADGTLTYSQASSAIDQAIERKRWSEPFARDRSAEAHASLLSAIDAADKAALQWVRDVKRECRREMRDDAETEHWLCWTNAARGYAVTNDEVCEIAGRIRM